MPRADPPTVCLTGAVCIGDRFELGVQSCVDRGLLTNTTIGHDVKIDNLCQVDNAKVGDRVRMSGMSGVAGSSVLEDDVVLAGAAIVKDHVTVRKAPPLGWFFAHLGRSRWRGLVGISCPPHRRILAIGRPDQ